MVNAMISWEQEYYDSSCYLFLRTPVTPLFPTPNRQVLHSESGLTLQHFVGATCDTTFPKTQKQTDAAFRLRVAL